MFSLQRPETPGPDRPAVQARNLLAGMGRPSRVFGLLRYSLVTLWVTTLLNVAAAFHTAGFTQILFSTGSSQDACRVNSTVGHEEQPSKVTESREPSSALPSVPTLEILTVGSTFTDPALCEAVAAESGIRADQAALKEITRRLDEAHILREHHELALKLIDSGQGVFRGFSPVADSGLRSPVQRFQDRIIQLEIEKQGLLVKFSPQSSEIRSMDMEIAGVRNAMRQCLIESLAFVRTDIEGLASRKCELERTAEKAGPKGAKGKGKCLHDSGHDTDHTRPSKKSLKLVSDNSDFHSQPTGAQDGEDCGFSAPATSPGLESGGLTASISGKFGMGAVSPLTPSLENGVFDNRPYCDWGALLAVRKNRIQLPEFTAFTVRAE